MKVYPKGCRYILVRNGSIDPQRKRTQRTTVMDLTRWQDDAFVVVQPRGKMKWWLYHSNKFVACGHDPDTLVMQALLS